MNETKARADDRLPVDGSGEQLVFNRDGRRPISLAVTPRYTGRVRGVAARMALIEDVMKDVSPQSYFGPDAARSQDFLYDDDGLPA